MTTAIPRDIFVYIVSFGELNKKLTGKTTLLGCKKSRK